MRRGVSSRRQALSFGATALFTAVALCGASAQDSRRDTGIVSGDCQTTAQKFVVATKPVASKTNGISSMLPESISFLQGKLGCVIVIFSAETKAPGFAGLQVRPLLDGGATSVPSTTLLSSNSAVYETHGMTYIFPGVSPGRHVLKIEVATSESSAMWLQARSIVLSYIK